MEAQEMESLPAQAQAQEIETLGIETAETPESENRERGGHEACQLAKQEAGIPAPGASCGSASRGANDYEPEAPASETQDAEALESQTRARLTPVRRRTRSTQEDETQLGAIRELMMRSFASGVWLTLGEIAGATEFGEASISAQLRHLRKRAHGRYRVEKRRRRQPRVAAAAKRSRIRATERAPIVWEYRVLPLGWGTRERSEGVRSAAEQNIGGTA